MSRPKRRRVISKPPKIEGFRPFGIPMSNMEPVTLLYEEYEAIKLADYEGLTHEEAAEKMDVSRPTFTRIYNKGLQSVAKAFVEGKAIIITGGDYHTDEFWYRCQSCNRTSTSTKKLSACLHCGSDNIVWLNDSPDQLRGRGRGRGAGRGAGAGGGRGAGAGRGVGPGRGMGREESLEPSVCFCISCQIEIPHMQGKPCKNHRCPQCGKSMIRKDGYHYQLYLKSRGEES